MNDHLKNLMMKDKKAGMGKMSPVEQNAKMSVLNHLRDMANEELGGKLKGIKKVSVMSDSPKGLETGLDKAKELVDPKAGMHEGMPEGSPEEEMMESPEEEMMEPAEEHMSADELDQKIQELMALKAKLHQK